MKNIIIATVSLLLLNACNTLEGVGKDVKKVGEAVESAARK